MKFQVLILSVVVCFIAEIPTPSNAQTPKKTWSVGPELGVNFSKFGRDADDTEYIPGLVIGGFVTYSTQNTYAYTAKVLFSQKGARDAKSNTTTRLNYVEVPVVARLFFNHRGIVRPNIFGGPFVGFLTGVKGKVSDGNFENIDNYRDSFKTFDLGVGIGFGLNIKVDNEMYFIVDTRYTYGFNDVSQSATYVNNQAIAISAGLSIGIGQRYLCRTYLWN